MIARNARVRGTSESRESPVSVSISTSGNDISRSDISNTLSVMDEGMDGYGWKDETEWNGFSESEECRVQKKKEKTETSAPMGADGKPGCANLQSVESRACVLVRRRETPFSNDQI